MANTAIIWKGAVEPAEISSSGNEIRLWKGGVQPSGVIIYSLTATSIESASELGTPVLANNLYSLTAVSIEAQAEVATAVITAAATYPRIRRLFVLTGRTDPEE